VKQTRPGFRGSEIRAQHFVVKLPGELTAGTDFFGGDEAFKTIHNPLGRSSTTA
jgi:hypothetical protein